MTPRDTDSGVNLANANPPTGAYQLRQRRRFRFTRRDLLITHLRICGQLYVEPLPRPALRRKNVVAIVVAVVVILQAQLEAVTSGHNRNVNFLIFESSSECTVIRVGGNSLPICRLPGWQLAHPKRGIGRGRQVLSALSTSHTKSSMPDSHLYVHNLRPSVPLHLHLKCQASKNSTNFLLPSTSQRWGRRTPGRTGGK